MFNILFASIFFCGVLLTSYFILDGIRQIVLTFNLFSPKKSRDLHVRPTPSILGAAFFILFVLGTFFYSNTFFPYIQYDVLVVSLLILTLTGIRDDLKIIRSSEKLIFQILAIGVLLYFNPNLLADDLYGFLGIYAIPIQISIPFTIFIGVAMINSFNLIDGIDGNAAIMGIISFLCFGIFFWIIDNPPFFGVSILLVGILIAYLPINFSSHRKGFMGDTGSMFIGFMLFLCTLVFINSESPYLNILLSSKSVLILGPLSIFSIPIIDSVSIYTYRIRIGKSPFVPDNFHVHHMVIRFFSNSHLISSLFLGIIALMIVIFMSYIVRIVPAFISITAYFTLITIGVLISFKYRRKLRTRLGARKGNVEVIAD